MRQSSKDKLQKIGEELFIWVCVLLALFIALELALSIWWLAMKTFGFWQSTGLFG